AEELSLIDPKKLSVIIIPLMLSIRSVDISKILERKTDVPVISSDLIDEFSIILFEINIIFVFPESVLTGLSSETCPIKVKPPTTASLLNGLVSFIDQFSDEKLPIKLSCLKDELSLILSEINITFVFPESVLTGLSSETCPTKVKLPIMFSFLDGLVSFIAQLSETNIPFKLSPLKDEVSLILEIINEYPDIASSRS